MSKDRLNERIFTEKEIRQVLRQATEIQEAEGAVQTQGLSQIELEQLASEIGIDPRYVAEAVARMREKEVSLDDDDGFYFFGLPPSYELERFVYGTVTDEIWDEMLATIRKTFRKPAKVNDWGQSKEWMIGGIIERTSVTVEQRGERTKVRMVWDAPLSRLIYCNVGFGFLFLSMLIGVGITPLAAFGMFLPVFAALFFLIRWAMSASVRSQRRKMKRVMSQLEQTVLQNQPKLEHLEAETTVRPGLKAPASPVLDIDEPTAESEKVLDPVRRRTSSR